jgi:competence protein ComEC
MLDRLALACVASFACGVFLASVVSLSWPFLLFLVLLSLILLAAWFFKGRTAYGIAAVIFLMVVVGGARVLVTPRTLPTECAPLLHAHISLAGHIIGDPDIRETSQRIPIEIESGGCHTKILAVADRYPEYAYGDEVMVQGSLEQPQPFDTDGDRTFAYDAFLAKDGIFGIVPRASLRKTGESSSLNAHLMRDLYAAKHAFIRGLGNALPEPHASLASGLLTGGKQGLGSDLLDAFTVTGLLPIIVLSGYNVMIVAEAVLRFLAFLPKRTALGVAGIVVALFVLAAGGGSSALRAALMAGLALFARATGRTYDALRALIAVFVLMLLANPLQLVYDPGFQFSFAATIGLMLGTSPLMTLFARIRPQGLRELLASTLAAQLCVLPLLLYQSGNLSIFSVPANILVLPFIPLAMAFSAGAGAIALVLPMTGPYVGLPAYMLLAYIIGVAQITATLPFARVIVPAFPFLLTVLMYVFLGWVLYKQERHRRGGA